MYDTVPEYSINMADPFWPLLLVPAAAVALSFLSADLAQRIASSRGYLKSGYVLGLLLGPLGVLIALGLPTRPLPLLHCLYDWYRRCDEYSGARWFIGQTLALALWVYLGLLALQAHAGQPRPPAPVHAAHQPAQCRRPAAGAGGSV